MKERGFNALDVRMMMQRPRHISASPGTGRWILDARLRGRSWRVVLDPDPVKREMVIVTAFPLRRRR
jgi:hypothetical protein